MRWAKCKPGGILDQHSYNFMNTGAEQFFIYFLIDKFTWITFLYLDYFSMILHLEEEKTDRQIYMIHTHNTV